MVIFIAKLIVKMYLKKRVFFHGEDFDAIHADVTCYLIALHCTNIYTVQPIAIKIVIRGY